MQPFLFQRIHLVNCLSVVLLLSEYPFSETTQVTATPAFRGSLLLAVTYLLDLYLFPESH